MAELEASSDTAGALRALLANARVPDMLAEHILGLGFQDIAGFAFAYSDIDLNTLLNEVPAEIWSALEVADHAHSIPAARIRKAFEIARAASSQETHAHMPKALSQPSGPLDAETYASPAIAWAEHLPPKLTPESGSGPGRQIPEELPRTAPGTGQHAKHPPAKHGLRNDQIQTL